MVNIQLIRCKNQRKTSSNHRHIVLQSS